MMRRIAAVLALVFSSSCAGQSADDVMRAFKRLEAHIETGISYRDYGPAVGDVNFELKMFRESPEGQANSELVKALSRALLRYVEAEILWGMKVDGTASLFATSDFGKDFVAKYPDAAKRTDAGGAALPDGSLSVQRMMGFIWRDAAAEVARAATLPR